METTTVVVLPSIVEVTIDVGATTVIVDTGSGYLDEQKAEASAYPTSLEAAF